MILEKVSVNDQLTWGSSEIVNRAVHSQNGSIPDIDRVDLVFIGSANCPGNCLVFNDFPAILSLFLSK